MDRKLIFFDIDGTLVSRLSAPSPAVREAIRQARTNGHLVFLCTGRNLPTIGANILEIGFDGVIASAGAYVVVDGEVLLDQLLSEELIQECLDVFHSLGMFCRLETPEGIYIDVQMEKLLNTASPDSKNSEIIRMQKEFESVINVRKYQDYPRKGAYKLSFTGASLESIQEAQAVLGDRFEFVVFPFASSATYFNGEIIPIWVNKGKAMELVCKHFGTITQNAIAFGDSMNDAAMLKRAGVGVAMGNACEELKSIADIICEEVAHDGVCQELHRMGLCG